VTDDKMIDAVEQSIRFVTRNGLVHPRVLAETAVMTMTSVQSVTEFPPGEVYFTPQEYIDQVDQSITMERDRVLTIILDAWDDVCGAHRNPVQSVICPTCRVFSEAVSKIEG